MRLKHVYASHFPQTNKVQDGSKTTKTPKIEGSYWSRENVLWTQGVYTRVQVQSMKKWSGAKEGSLSGQTLMTLFTEERSPLSLRNQFLSLRPIFESKSKVHLKGILDPSFLDPAPYWKPILSQFLCCCQLRVLRPRYPDELWLSPIVHRYYQVTHILPWKMHKSQN